MGSFHFDENHRRSIHLLFCVPSLVSHASLPPFNSLCHLHYETQQPLQPHFPFFFFLFLFLFLFFFFFFFFLLLLCFHCQFQMLPEKLPSGGSRQPKPISDHNQHPLKCPRCDSPNTKFCYYNNYSLTQPRYFCKTCRRYWTKGGALRNVPVGGGCRKNKKLKSSSSSPSLRLPSSSNDDSGSSNSEIGRLGFFVNGFSSAQLSGNRNSSFSSAPTMGLYDQFGGFSLDQSRSLNNSFINPSTGFVNSLNVDTSLASSIESLSSMNQDLHWKLQQQRLAMLFGSGHNNTAIDKNRGVSSPIALEDHGQELNPGSFRNLEISKPEACNNSSDFSNARKETVVDAGARAGGESAVADEWFFGDSYTAPSMTTTGAAAAGYNSGDSAARCDGVQEWHDLHPYTHLP